MPFLLFWQFSPTTQSESKGNKSKFQTWGSRSILIPLTQSLLSLTIRSWCNVFIDPLNIALLCFVKEKRKSLWEITISIDPDEACPLFPNVCQKTWKFSCTEYSREHLKRYRNILLHYLFRNHNKRTFMQWCFVQMYRDKEFVATIRHS